MNFTQPRIYKLFSVLFIITGLLSCSKRVVEPDVPEGNVPLEFSAFVDWGVKSKSLINNAEDLQSYSMSLLANAEVAENVYPVFENNKLYYSGETWTYGAAEYWKYGAKYSFTAFAPFASDDPATNTLSNGDISFSDNVLTIENYSTAAIDSRTEDLLVAHYVRDNSSDRDFSAVPLNFEHILACVSFSIRNATNNDYTTVSAIKLKGLQSKCNITLNPSSVTVVNSTETSQEISSADRTGNPFLPKGMSEEEYKPLFDCEYLTLLPQELYGKDAIKLTFKVHKGTNDSNGTEYSFSLGDVETLRRWEAGKKYDYSISITSTEILFQVVEVPWIVHDVEL